MFSRCFFPTKLKITKAIEYWDYNDKQNTISLSALDFISVSPPKSGRPVVIASWVQWPVDFERIVDNFFDITCSNNSCRYRYLDIYWFTSHDSTRYHSRSNLWWLLFFFSFGCGLKKERKNSVVQSSKSFSFFPSSFSIWRQLIFLFLFLFSWLASLQPAVNLYSSIYYRFESGWIRSDQIKSNHTIQICYTGDIICHSSVSLLFNPIIINLISTKKKKITHRIQVDAHHIQIIHSFPIVFLPSIGIATSRINE